MEKLISLSNLFKDSFKIYKQNFLVFVKLTSINFLAFLILLTLGVAFFLTKDNSYTSTILFFISTIFFLVAIFLMFWVQVSIIFTIKERDNRLSIKQILLKAWPYLGSFAWISLLTSLAVLGGFILFIIPGIIFSVYFLFSKYVLFFEDKKGNLALIRSAQLVQGNWWAVFGRFLLVGILAGIISYIPLLGSLINMFFTVPFVAIYICLMYEDLKRIKSISN